MTAKNRTSGAVSIADIMEELNCSRDLATDIMMLELPHYDIAKRGAKRPTWRAKRKDFDAWMVGREREAGKETIKRFNEQYMRRR